MFASLVISYRPQKNNSAPGEDMIPYSLLKLCADSSLRVICDLFNQCLSKNIFPIAWKTAKLRMLAKPVKDRKEAGSNRPISLLSYLVNLFERFIYMPLIPASKEKQFFSEIQVGFSKGRSTQEHLLRLAQGVSNEFKRRDCTVAVFLDVKAAFYAVWINGLKFKIKQIGLSQQMEKLLFSFLDNRTLRVFIDEAWSRSVELGAGTPQG